MPKKTNKSDIKAVADGVLDVIVHVDLSQEEQQKMFFEYALKKANEAKEKIEAGDGDALIQTLITWCLISKPMPIWLRNALYGRLHNYTNHKVASLDEAFNLKPKTHIKAKKRENDYSLAVWLNIKQLQKLGFPFDDAMLTCVGELYHIGRTKTYEFYSLQEERQGNKFYFGDEFTYENLSPKLWDIFDKLNSELPAKKRIKKNITP